MGIWHGRSGRTKTGARLRKFRSKRKHQLGRVPTETLMGEDRVKVLESKGDVLKTPVITAKFVNVTDSKKNTTVRAEIQDVEENSASMDYQRRKVITRGTIIKTTEGRARVTSRPGQDGVLNAILI
ncbi:MAG: 30S ribosomal protein S8e [Candidatus Thorarchaeota archaeon]